MLRATIKSLLARKLRLALTALAVVLGVGFTAGTYVLTDTALKSFDDLFSNVYAGTDVVVQGTTAFTPERGWQRWRGRRQRAQAHPREPPSDRASRRWRASGRRRRLGLRADHRPGDRQGDPERWRADDRELVGSRRHAGHGGERSAPVRPGRRGDRCWGPRRRTISRSVRPSASWRRPVPGPSRSPASSRSAGPTACSAPRSRSSICRRRRSSSIARGISTSSTSPAGRG